MAIQRQPPRWMRALAVFFERQQAGVPQQKTTQGLTAAILSEETVTAAMRMGVASDWAPTNYGNYYATTAPVYAAIRKRAASAVRPALLVYKRGADESLAWVGTSHPAQSLLDRVNPFWSRGQFIRGLTTYLDIWGSAFVALSKPAPGRPPDTMWLLRPDKTRILPDKERYIAGFVYDSGTERVVLLPEEVIWFRYFNPLDELAGLAPMAPLRLSADIHLDALRHNRDQFINRLNYDQLMISAEEGTSQEEIDAFYKRLEDRHAGRGNAFRPLIMAGVKDSKMLGFSPREMEHLTTLRWTLEDVSRVYDVPKILLGDLERATYSNVDAAERIFWRSMADHLAFLEEQLNEFLMPQFGPDLVARFDLSKVEALQPDASIVADRQRQDVVAGVVTINEVRTERNLPPVPWGDAWWASATLLPVEDAAANPQASAASGEASLLAPTVKDVLPDQYRHWLPPSLTEDGVEALLDIHVKRLGAREKTFGGMQKRLFERQERDILERLRATAQQPLSVLERAIRDVEHGSIFDASAWTAAYIEAGRPVDSTLLTLAAQDVSDDFSLAVAFDVKHPRVQEWLDDRVKFWAERVNEETARLIVSEMDEAAQLGESIRDIEKRVSKVFGYSKGTRTEMIARTETQAAMNRGALEAYRQSGVVPEKMWLATLDERTRDWHAEAHRQVVPLDAPFIVHGEAIMQPGEGSAENAINCRCRLIPLVQSPRRQRAVASHSR